MTTKPFGHVNCIPAGYIDHSDNIDSKKIHLSDDEVVDAIRDILKINGNPPINEVMLALCQRIVMLERSVTELLREKDTYKQTDGDVI